MGCTTPYAPPVVVKGSPEFHGIAHLLDPARPLDVVLVHGMCTHDERWAYATMNGLLRAMDVNLKPEAPQVEVAGTGPGPRIQVIQREDTIAGNKLRLSAIVWSPLTTPLKRQLAYDNTGTPLDCSTNESCKPVRAKYNGQFKDGLLNDCLADAMIYEGVSRPVIRNAMVAALARVLDGASPGAPLVLVSDSLGSKMTFDALAEMLGEPGANASSVNPAGRLAQVFMNANQLPLLSLADQSVSQPPPEFEPKPAPPVDALQKLLRVRKDKSAGAQVQGGALAPLPQPLSTLKVVAFTDPNDLLSYRLDPDRYRGDNVKVTNVLVSNDKTYLGLIERPDTAHTGYKGNEAVMTFTACGWPKSALCK